MVNRGSAALGAAAGRTAVWVAALLLWWAPARAQETMNIWSSFASTDMSFVGFSSIEFLTAIEEFRRAMEQASGFEVHFKLAPGVNRILSKMQSGEAEFGFLSRTDYYVARRQGLPVSAASAPIVAGSSRDRSCIVGSIKLAGRPLAELRGADCGMLALPETDFSKWPETASYTNLWDYFNFRWILAENGVDMSVWDFCGSLAVDVDSAEVGLLSAALGRFDLVVSTEYSLRIIQRHDPRVKDLVPLYCGPEGPTAPFVHHTGLDPAVIEKMKEQIDAIDIPRDFPTIQRVMFIDGIVKVDDEDYEVYTEWFDECIERGYLDEIARLQEVYP